LYEHLVHGLLCPNVFSFSTGSRKYLKSFIVANKLNFRAVHNLLELLEICKQHELGIKETEPACRFLNSSYIDTRYPVHWPTHYSKDTAVKAKEMTDIIRNWVIKSLAL